MRVARSGVPSAAFVALVRASTRGRAASSGCLRTGAGVQSCGATSARRPRVGGRPRPPGAVPGGARREV